MDNSFINRLKEVMEERGIKVPALSIATGIPQDRIYKWFKQGTNPKAKDTQVLNDWINGENYSRKLETKALPDKDHPDLLRRYADATQHSNELLLRLLDEKITAIETNLNKNQEYLKVIMAQIKAASRLAVERSAGTDKKKMLEERRTLDKYVGEYLDEFLQKDTI